MGNKEVHVDSNIFDTFKDQLKYDCMTLRVILHCDHYAFEYNFKDHSFRPFSSLFWYKLDKNKFNLFVKYVEAKCSIVEDEFESTGHVSRDTVEENIGYYENGYIIIDMDQIRTEIDKDMKYINEHNLNAQGILCSLSDTIDRLKYAYRMNKIDLDRLSYLKDLSL